MQANCPHVRKVQVSRSTPRRTPLSPAFRAADSEQSEQQTPQRGMQLQLQWHMGQISDEIRRRRRFRRSRRTTDLEATFSGPPELPMDVGTRTDWEIRPTVHRFTPQVRTEILAVMAKAVPTSALTPSRTSSTTSGQQAAGSHRSRRRHHHHPPTAQQGLRRLSCRKVRGRMGWEWGQGWETSS